MRAGLMVVTLLALAPLAALADNYPFVQDGPVIVGVTDTDAWVVWYTGHHEGTGTECTIEEDTPLLGDHNTDTPTLTLNTGTQFSNSNCDRYHPVHLTGLTASTAYTFTLDKPWDELGGTIAAGAFTTAPPAGSGAGVKFVVYGDTRNDIALGGTDTRPDHQAVVDAIIANEPDSSFLVHTGDMALNITAVSGDDKGYTEFFAVERNLLANRPVWVVLGNHETIDTTFFDAMMDPARFDNSPHPYYSSFDWGKVHIAMGDSFEGSATTLGLGGLNPGISMAQTEWLDADLQAAHAAGQTSLLAIHQGPYSHFAPASTDGHGGLQAVVTDFIPIMLQYGTLASLAGHDHYYERGHEGCIDYMVLGGGGAPQYAPDPTASGVIVAQEKLTYMVVTVASSGSASMVVKDTSGNIVDTFQFVTPDPNCVVPIDSDAGVDGGSDDDAGVDAGSDAGAIDAGTDAGTNADAGIDAGNPIDAGDDAGLADAGTDGGFPEQIASGGCGCNSAGDSMLEGLALVLAFGLRRWRKDALE